MRTDHLTGSDAGLLARLDTEPDRAMEALVEKFTQKALDTENHIVAISHGDCLEEAQALADAVTAIAKPRQLIICQHEPFSGAHVGPGMLALFFYGTSR